MAYFFSEINVTKSIITIFGAQNLYGTSKVKNELIRGKEIVNQSKNYLDKELPESESIQSKSLTYVNSLNFKVASMFLGFDLRENRQKYLDYVRARVIGRYIEDAGIRGLSLEDKKRIECDLNIDFTAFTKKVFSRSFAYEITIWDYIESMFSYFELSQYLLRNCISPRKLSDDLKFNIAWEVYLPIVALLLFSDVKDTLTAQAVNSASEPKDRYTPISQISLIDALPNYSPLKYIEEATDKLLSNDVNFSLVQRHWVSEILGDLELSTLKVEFNLFKENRLNKLNSKSPVSIVTIIADFKLILAKLKQDKDKYTEDEYNDLVASLNKACACMSSIMILQRLFYYFKPYNDRKVEFFKQIKDYIARSKSISTVEKPLDNRAFIFKELYQSLLAWNPDTYTQDTTHYAKNDDLKYIIPVFQMKKLFHWASLNNSKNNSISNQLEGLSLPLYRKTITKRQPSEALATWLNMDYFYTTEKVLCLLKNQESEPQFEPVFYFYKCLQALKANQLELAKEHINKSFESLNSNFDNICIGIYVTYIMAFYIGLLNSQSIKYNKVSKYATYLTPNNFTHNHLIDSLVSQGFAKKEITWSILFVSVRLFNYFSYRQQLKELIFNPFKPILVALAPFFQELNILSREGDCLDAGKIYFLLTQAIPNKSVVLKLNAIYLDINIIVFIKHIKYYFNLYSEMGLHVLNPNEPLIDYLCNSTTNSQVAFDVLLKYLESE